jgi:hypothetical protein
VKRSVAVLLTITAACGLVPETVTFEDPRVITLLEATKR